MSTGDATMPEPPQAEVSATTGSTTVAPDQPVKSAALPLPGDPAAEAMLRSSHRAIEEMAPDLEAHLGKLTAEERLSLAEPLARLVKAASAAPAAKALPAAEILPAAEGLPAVRPLLRPSALMPLVWAMAAVAAWLVLFAAGVSIPAAPYITLLDHMAEAKTSVLGLLGAGVMVVLCSTFTNPGILACLAAFLGGVAKGVQPVDSSSADRHADAPQTAVAECLAAVVRGFYLYLVLLSGLLLLTTKAITDGTQEQYVQLAGTVSVLAFMVGFDSNFFFRIMRRLDDWTQQKSQRSTGAEKQRS